MRGGTSLGGYGLGVKCPPQAHVFKNLSPDGMLWGEAWGTLRIQGVGKESEQLGRGPGVIQHGLFLSHPDASSQPHNPVTMLRVTSVTLPSNQGGHDGSSQSCEP